MVSINSAIVHVKKKKKKEKEKRRPYRAGI
jgi:hypothetical protein